MKKFLPLILSCWFLCSCTSEDDGGDIMQELASVISVDLPEEFSYGGLYDIEIVYNRPSNCHTFSGLDVSQQQNQITIGVVTSFRTSNSNCVASGDLESTAQINFVAERDDFYIFRFWQGRSVTGRDQFLTIEVPVNPPGIE